jgi:hypothetical protein
MFNRRTLGTIAALVVLPTAIVLGSALALPMATTGTDAHSGLAVAPGSPDGVPGCEPVVLAAVFVLNNASSESCFVFVSTLATPSNISLTWVAFPGPAIVEVVLGPAVPVGAVACPLFVAELYSANGTAGSAVLPVVSSPPRMTSGCLWPYHLSATANGSVGLAMGEAVVATLAPTGPSDPACGSTGSVSVNNTSYWACQATLDWAAVDGTAPGVLLATTFHGVQFTVDGYNTADCSVVNVTGVEPSGATDSFLIAPAPIDCQVASPTVFSADSAFGASWSGGSSIELLVRA